TAFHFDITDMVKDEQIVTIQADSLTLELRNEQIPAYKATKAMSFEEYLKVFLFTGDNPLVMGFNEVSNKKLQLEWEAEDSNIMSRLFSLATKFDAEIEFVTRLNQHWGLLDIVLNVFVANSDKYQGIGNNRQDIILELGNNVETIEIHENIDDLKTAIKPIGKDGLLITNVVIDEKDADGNRLFYSPKGDAHIRAVQAKNQFISKVNGEGYISYPWEYDTENENVLAGQGLAELKKRAKVTLTVTVKGFDKTLQIGDTVRVLNEAYNPSLNMTMRVSELDIYFDKPSNDSGVFTNAQILQSEVDTTLLARVQTLIEANKVFTNEIITSDGVTFKNGFGSTTLTARVRDGIKDVTDTFGLKWYKDGTLVSNTKTVTINAADIEEKAVFRFEVADDSGNVRGGAEVTVTNIDDGQQGEPGKSPIITVNDDSSLTIEDDEGTKQTEPLKGESGKGVSAEEISYSISQDGTTPPTSGWSGTRPTPKAGWYMWTRTRFKYTDNTYSAYFYLVAQQGNDAIVISDTAPANPTKGTLWQDSSVTPQIIKVFDGVAWGVWGMPIDNLLATNILSENGVFKRLEGAEIVGSEFINPYTRTYNDGTFAQGTQRIGSAELYNSGVIKNSQGTTTQSYEAIFSHQLVSMTRYSGESLGDQNELIAAMGLTFDSLTLNNQQTGFAGTLTAEMLYDTGWLKVTRLKGTAGDIYLKRYMNRILIRFDRFVWDGSANGTSTSNAVAILPDKVREGFPQMFTVPVWIEGNATEKFQVENGRLYKLSNNSGNSRITAVGEVYI
ncbi:MAG: phage tail spike protein, partial [Enterococcus faecalis]|nr:phage tail spike protein [Enterococcus faecalis]